jgi:heptaprenyl diphosphate synthase
VGVLLFRGAYTDPDLHAEALELLRTGPGPDRTRADARRYADLARAALAPLPAIPARAALEAMCDGVLTRVT